jgi:PA domain
VTSRLIRAGIAFALALAALPLAAADIQIVVSDGPGVGFNDPTPATPVGGNTGTTVGAQRLIVFQEAARIWGGLLPSNVGILITSSFQALDCDANSAVLGSAGATTVHANFAGAPVANTWYNKAEADKLSGTSLGTNPASIRARFNSELGKTSCLKNIFFYLGLDNNHGSNVNLLSVVLHEFGHGLGFQSATDANGTFLGSGTNQFPGAFDRFLFDATAGKTWDQMATDADRMASSTNTGNLRWNGPRGAVYANAYMSKRPRLLVTAPAAAAGTYVFGSADFGPPLSSQNVNGQIVAGLSGSATDGCNAITSNVSGSIALIDRGICNFTVKVKNAQNAGAIAAIIVDNVAQGIAGMGGTDPTITIPSVRVTLADGTKLRANLPASASLGLDAAQYAGADASGRLLMYSPNPYESGSSVSHWDTTASPNLLMEPNISSDLGSTVDATLAAFQDIGWFLGSTAIPTTYVLPSSAHAQGKGNSFYTTGLTITNAGTSDAIVTLKFLGHDRDGRTGPEVVRTVAAGATATYPDVLGSVFGLSSDYGSLRINADSNQLRIVSQTSTPPPSGPGTFGQAVPAQGGNDVVTTAAPKLLFPLRQDGAFRTNVVLANTTESPAHVDLQLFTAGGTLLGTRGYDLDPLGMHQIGTVILEIGGPGADGTSNAVLQVSTPTANARIATYAAAIDQTTSDPRTVLPVTLGALGANMSWLLPSSAHAQGKNNAFYTTDLTIANTDSTTASVTLKFLGHEKDGRTGPEAVRTIPGNGAIALTDVLGSVFGISSDYGSILVTPTTANVKVVSQTSTPPPDGNGTFGQSVPAFGAADFVTLAAPRALVGLREDAAFRTNAVIANATDQPAHVDLTLKSETDATLTTGSYDLQPYEMRQIGTVITTLGGPGLQGTANAALWVSTTTPGARIATYAAVIDNNTSDPRTILP